MTTRRVFIVGAFLVALGMTQSSATEVMLQPITIGTLQGEWEGAWRDKIAERLIVVYLSVTGGQHGVLTIVHGPPSNPFIEPFAISKVDCSDGKVTLHGTGSNDAQGATITVTGPGWALARDGQLDVSLQKVTRSGRTIGFDVRLVKFEGGFLRRAQQLAEIAKKSAARATPP